MSLALHSSHDHRPRPTVQRCCVPRAKYRANTGETKRRSYCMNELLWMRLVMSFPWFIHSQATAVWQCVWACVVISDSTRRHAWRTSYRPTDRRSVARQCCVSQPCSHVTAALLCLMIVLNVSVNDRARGTAPHPWVCFRENGTSWWLMMDPETERCIETLGHGRSL